MIAIHDRPGSFSDRWIEYCTTRRIAFERVDCLGSDIVNRCKGVDAVLWHWSHGDPADRLVARQVIFSLEQAGKLVFPSVATCWHFDDKIAQKYLLEAIGAPLVPSYVFTRKDDALRWIETATWPKVFKLRCGAGSNNVRLVRSQREAQALCNQAFGRGFPMVPGYLADLRTRIRKAKNPAQFREKLSRAPRTLMNLLALRRALPREKGYIYFQDFLPNNAFDTRITVIGNRAFGFRRLNRPGDFRASGSGKLDYTTELINPRCVEVAFKVTNRIGAQSLAFDFLVNAEGEATICEISYCYMASAVYACQGHWDSGFNWHAGQIWPQDAIIEDVLSALARRGTRDVGGK